MIPLREWEEWIEGKRYSTQTSVLIARGMEASDRAHEAGGWNIFLYRTPENTYFKVHLIPSGSKHHVLEPVTAVEALMMLLMSAFMMVKYWLARFATVRAVEVTRNLIAIALPTSTLPI